MQTYSLDLQAIGNNDSISVDVFEFTYSGPLGTYTDETILNHQSTWYIGVSGIANEEYFSFDLTSSSSQWEFDYVGGSGSSGTSSFTATGDRLFFSADDSGFTNLVGEPVYSFLSLSDKVDFSLIGSYGEPYFTVFDVYDSNNLSTESINLSQSTRTSDSTIVFSRLQTVTDGGDAFGADFSDSLFGDAGENRLFGEGGDDLLDGGLGQDKYTGGRGADTFVIRVGEGLDTIRDFHLWQGDRIALGSGLSYDDLIISRFGRNGARLSFNGEDLAIVQADRFGAVNESAFTTI